MRSPAFVIITALSMFYLGKSSFRNISLILCTAFDINISHTNISNWCHCFAPLFDNMRLKLLPMLDFNSNEWHADKTVIKISGVKHYLWLVVDSETRFITDFHLSPHRTTRKPLPCWRMPSNMVCRPLLSATVTVPTRYQSSPSCPMRSISACRILRTISPTTGLSALTNNSKPGIRQNRAFPVSLQRIISSPCLSFPLTLFVHILLLAALLRLKLPAFILLKSKNGSICLWRNVFR